MQPFPHPSDATHKIWSRLANWLQKYSSLKVWMTTMDRRLVYYKLTLWLKLWAFFSGELIKVSLRWPTHCCQILFSEIYGWHLGFDFNEIVWKWKKLPHYLKSANCQGNHRTQTYAWNSLGISTVIAYAVLQRRLKNEIRIPCNNKIIIAPLWKSGGYTGFALSFRHSVTVIP